MQVSWQLRAELRIYLVSFLLGALTGIFILYPASEFVYFTEYGPPKAAPASNSALTFVSEQMKRSVTGQTPRKTVFYAAVGVLLSIAGRLSSPACTGGHRRSRGSSQPSRKTSAD